MAKYISTHTGREIDNLLDKAENLPSSSGTAGQLLVKTLDGSEWQDVVALPVGGNIGQVLIKNGLNDGDATWSTNIEGNAATATSLSSTLAISKGGTGATSAQDARTSLGVSPAGKIEINGTLYEIRLGTEGALGYVTIVVD